MNNSTQPSLRSSISTCLLLAIERESLQNKPNSLSPHVSHGFIARVIFVVVTSLTFTFCQYFASNRAAAITHSIYGRLQFFGVLSSQLHAVWKNSVLIFFFGVNKEIENPVPGPYSSAPSVPQWFAMFYGGVAVKLTHHLAGHLRTSCSSSSVVSSSSGGSGSFLSKPWQGRRWSTAAASTSIKEGHPERKNCGSPVSSLCLRRRSAQTIATASTSGFVISSTSTTDQYQSQQAGGQIRWVFLVSCPVSKWCGMRIKAVDHSKQVPRIT